MSDISPFQKVDHFICMLSADVWNHEHILEEIRSDTENTVGTQQCLSIGIQVH